jgi:predicted DNA-binding protein (MmcQ/YjbR family)
MPTATFNSRRLEAALRKHALAYPETHEAFPWGERVVNVKGKVFIFMYGQPKTLSVTVKLPASHDFALMFPFAERTGYGLGKSGWVTSRLAAGSTLPLELLKEWIDESYRAVAPKSLVDEIPGLPAKKKRSPSPPKKARR